MTNQYKKESHEVQALKEFCKRLSEVTGEDVTFEPIDDRGRNGENLPEGKLIRDGKCSIIEHTMIVSYRDQVRDNERWFFTPFSRLEQYVRNKFPQKHIWIYIDIDSLPRRDDDLRNLNIDVLKDDVEEAISCTEVHYEANQFKTHLLKQTKLKVKIAIGKTNGTCWIDPIRTVQSNSTLDVEMYLKENILKALSRKEKKLKISKSEGLPTILLLETRDIFHTNIDILAKICSNVINSNPEMVNGIDDIYLIYPIGLRAMAPIKLSDRIYPNLREFRQFINTLCLNI